MAKAVDASTKKLVQKLKPPTAKPPREVGDIKGLENTLGTVLGVIIYFDVFLL